MRHLNIICIICGLSVMVSCSQSGRRQLVPADEATSVHASNRGDRNFRAKTVVKMEWKDGVYQFPIEINGVRMSFIFDTGAGMVSISVAEAIFLYKQGKLTEEDFLGTANFLDANGAISEGTVINLKTVKIADRTLANVRASVVHNMEAPLLLGQTVLEEFDKISIDNKRGEIVFE